MVVLTRTWEQMCTVKDPSSSDKWARGAAGVNLPYNPFCCPHGTKEEAWTQLREKVESLSAIPLERGEPEGWQQPPQIWKMDTFQKNITAWYKHRKKELASMTSGSGRNAPENCECGRPSAKLEKRTKNPSDRAKRLHAREALMLAALDNLLHLAQEQLKSQRPNTKTVDARREQGEEARNRAIMKQSKKRKYNSGGSKMSADLKNITNVLNACETSAKVEKLGLEFQLLKEKMEKEAKEAREIRYDMSAKLNTILDYVIPRRDGESEFRDDFDEFVENL